jgi:hypothetical protein
MHDLRAKIVFQRLRNARRDSEASRIAVDDERDLALGVFYANRAAFWQAAARAAADGDLSPVTFNEAAQAAADADLSPVTLCGAA